MNYLSEDKFVKVYLYTFAKTVFPSLIILTEKKNCDSIYNHIEYFQIYFMFKIMTFV